MKFRLDIRSEAEADIAAAANWYGSEAEELGEDFTTEVRRAIRSLASNAKLYRVRARRRGKEVRWLLSKRFPYHILYYIEGNAVKIFAVLHAKRHDRAWKKRA